MSGHCMKMCQLSPRTERGQVLFVFQLINFIADELFLVDQFVFFT
jgi:hypothetical protein